MRNDLTIYDTGADRWWSDDMRWVRTLKNLVPGCLRWFDRQIDWQGKVVLDLGRAGGFMAEALALPGFSVGLGFNYVEADNRVPPDCFVPSAAAA